MTETKSDDLMNVNNNSVKKWDRFYEWIHCICIVTFDLEIGQAMEIIYPSNAKLSEQEKMNVCYLAFPDSNSGCMGDTKFHIRLRVGASTENTFLRPAHVRFNKTCIPVQRADCGHYWGFVFFRQIKDNSLPRGYFQKSLVILTRLPFINFFYEIVSLIAPLYFEKGDAVLEAACDNICNWPPLIPGDTINLQILGTKFQTFIPGPNTKAQNYILSGHEDNVEDDFVLIDKKPVLPPHVLASLHEIDMFKSLYSVMSHINLLWELVLTAEPIVVMGASPTDCSSMVQALTSLIAPLAYCAETRPYFTIHDSEFKEFTQRQQGPPSVILGVTNPFFSKTLQHWPHTIRLIDGLTGTPNQPKLKKVKGSSKTLDTAPGVYTQYKPFLSKEKAVIKKISLGIKTKRPGPVQSAILRRHLLELTQSFMIPLERYMGSLLPLKKDISPFKAAPKPRQFKQDDFLATLESSGPQLTSTARGDWEGLYKKFFRSPNFKGWYELRYHELTQKLQTLQLQALSDADLKKWVQGKHEVEIVDMILKIRQKLKLCSDETDSEQITLTTSGTSMSSSTSSTISTNLSNGLRKETKAQLLQHLEDMKLSLPDDLKTILNNPAAVAVTIQPNVVSTTTVSTST